MTTLTTRWSYDVFLSFRGEDTRNNFISHLHYALNRSNINAFIDDKLRRGHTISSTLIQAIESSRIAIIVFSQNFASSTWCLDEVVKILECKESRGQLVRPVFFHVDPSQMRKQTEIFQEFFAKWEMDFRDDPEKVDRWRSALREAANLSGWHIDQNVIEAELVQKIVEEISSKLRRSELPVALHPVGLEGHIQAINMLLNTNDDKVHMVTICGAGGIGKTTIAKAVFNQIADQFEGSSFLMDVRETSRQFGQIKLQEALLHDILGDTSIKVGYMNAGVKLIRNMLQDKRVLLILDDVDHMEQIQNLTGGGEWFSKGSTIIVTTRNEKILAAQDAEIYRVLPLNYNDAVRLFSSNAFQRPSPKTDYQLMAFQLTNYAKGLPLALIVLGSFLNGKTRQEWDWVLDCLKQMPQGGVDKILKISFDGLEAHEKAIFLDIACFFKGEDISYVTKMLDRCNFYPESGIEILQERSLIYIESNKIWMHEMVQEYGREIVYQESPRFPGRRSRLWYHEDVMRVLKENSGTNAVEGIKLDMLDPEEIFECSKAIKNMTKLRLILVHDLHISGCPEYLSNNLRWLDIGRGDDLPNSGQSPFYDQFDNIEPHFSPMESSSKPTLKMERVKFRSIFSKINVVSWYKKRQRGNTSEKRRWQKDHVGELGGHMEGQSDNGILGIKQFSLEELRHGTNNFSADNKIGLGGFGSTYCASLDDGQKVAIKRAGGESSLHSSYQDRAFVTELKILSRMKHENLVCLIGFLEEGNEKMLVYEYVHNGSLYKHLHGVGSPALMSWPARLRLALEVALGIEYLHCGTSISVIHGDVKVSNILLDSNWTAKVSDFGLSRLITDDDDASDYSDSRVAGTVGYLDPEVYSSGKLTIKSDVYGFGVVLLELLSGSRPIYWDKHGSNCYVVEAIVPLISQGAIRNALAKNMPEATPVEMEALAEMASVAAQCVNLESKKRPTMTEVVCRLTHAVELFC